MYLVKTKESCALKLIHFLEWSLHHVTPASSFTSPQTFQANVCTRHGNILPFRLLNFNGQWKCNTPFFNSITLVRARHIPSFSTGYRPALRRNQHPIQAVSRRSPTAEARGRSWVTLCGICGGQSGTGRGFPPEYFGFSLSISYHRCSITQKYGKKTNHLHHIFKQ